MFGIPALKASIYANIALGIALLAATGGWWLHAKSLRADATTAEAAATVAKGERDTLQASLSNLTKATNLQGESLAKVRGALEQCQARKQAQQQAGMMAVQRLDAELADANATLADIVGRYEAAMRDPDCLICASRPVCPALVAP
jgi:hypothetical protein